MPLNLPVTRDGVFGYDVPDFWYGIHVSVPMTSEGYEEVAAAFRRNVALAVVTVNRERFNQFMQDWTTTLAYFTKAGVFTKDEGRKKMQEIREFPQKVVEQGTQAVVRGLQGIAQAFLVRRWKP